MRVVLSTIGSRGEAQPMVAVALALRALGHEAVVCGPPDFSGWADSLGVEWISVGPQLRATAEQPRTAMPTPEQRRAMIEGTVTAQFQALRQAAGGCDVIVGGGALAIGAHSIAEHVGARYVYTAFVPITLPSPHHAPPVFAMLNHRPDDSVDNTTLWEQERARWDAMWRDALNAQRDDLGLAPMDGVRAHLFTETPWLAADSLLAPWPGAPMIDVVQTGAWALPEPAPLAPDVEAFLSAGEPPVYLGFGSMRAPEGVTHAVIDAARATGRRVIIARGWSRFEAPDGATSDCLVVDDVDHQALFPHVAAVVHHGGAGTTTAAALSGAPQVIAPQMFDQPYFARRISELGVGSAIPATPTPDDLHAAFATALGDDARGKAQELARHMRRDGADHAAGLLVAQN